MDAPPGFVLVVVEPPEVAFPGRLSHAFRACTYLVPPALARSLRPRSGRVITSEVEEIRGAPNRMRKTVCMGKRSTQSDLGGWGSPKTLPEESGSPCSDLIAHRNGDWRGLLPSYQSARTWTANGSRTLNSNGRNDVSAMCRKLIVNEPGTGPLGPTCQSA